jgi:hypothetical protein
MSFHKPRSGKVLSLPQKIKTFIFVMVEKKQRFGVNYKKIKSNITAKT